MKGHPVLKIWSHIRLARPVTSLVTLLGAWAATRIGGLTALPVHTVLLGGISAALLAGASMCVNDWHDVDEDRINKPERPIPMGEVQRAHAFYLGSALFVAGVLCGALAHPTLGWIALLVSLLSFYYTFSLKRVLFVGNNLVALLATYPLWCWLPLMSQTRPAFLMLTISAYIFLCGREVLKTAEDFAGDRACAIRTVATAKGVRFANRLGAALLACALLACWPPALLGKTTLFYDALLVLSTLLVGAVGFEAFFSRRAEVPQTGGKFARIAQVILYLMATAFAFGYT